MDTGQEFHFDENLKLESTPQSPDGATEVPAIRPDITPLPGQSSLTKIQNRNLLDVCFFSTSSLPYVWTLYAASVLVYVAVVKCVMLLADDELQNTGKMKNNNTFLIRSITNKA